MQTNTDTGSASGTIVRTGVCIVGGGPAGLLLGLLLAKRGANVLVLEAHKNFDREFRGEVLQPSTARLLHQLGLLPYILEQPHLLLKEGRLLVDGQVRAGFSFDKIAPEYPYAIWMPQPIFLDALARKAAPYPGFQLWMGANVTELIEENGSVVGVRGLRDGKAAEKWGLRFNSSRRVTKNLHGLIQLLDLKRLFQHRDGTDLQDSVKDFAVGITRDNDYIQIWIDLLCGLIYLVSRSVR